MEELGTGAGRFKLRLQIGSAKQIPISFFTRVSGVDTAEDISGKTFVFFIKKYKGARGNILKYTNQSGITVPIYSTNEILINILAADVTEVEEGEFYWELRREDLDQPKLAGTGEFTYDA